MRSWGIRVIGVMALVLAVVGVGAALTGSLSYVTTHGTSMEPGFHQGDLAVVRSSDRYGTGDVVAYHSDLLDTTVMHRIVDRSGDRFIFKGDNNAWLDRDQPTKADFTGKLLLRVPKGGLVLGMITRPPVLAAGLVLMGGLRETTRRARRPGARRMARKHVAGPPPRVAQMVRRTAWAAAAALGTTLFLAFQAFGSAPTEAGSAKVPYTHHGMFSYSAAVPDDRVYQSGQVTTGDPVFRRLVDVLDLDFTYEMTVDAPHALEGTVRLEAEIRNASGWKRTIELSPSRAFTGDRASAAAQLDLAQFQRVIDEAEALTGIPEAKYDVTVVPRVEVRGSIAGRPVDDAFAPTISFTLDQGMLAPTGEEPASSGSNAVYEPSENGSVSGAVVRPRSIGLAGRRLAVSEARQLSVFAVAVSALVLAAALVLSRPSRRDEPARIKARHGHRIIPIAMSGDNGRHDIVDVRTMEDLVRLAEQYGCLVLSRDVDGTSIYQFQVEQTVYRFQVRDRRHVRVVS